MRVLLFLLVACDGALVEGAESVQEEAEWAPGVRQPGADQPAGWLVTDWSASANATSVTAGADRRGGAFTMDSMMCGLSSSSGSTQWDVDMGENPVAQDQNSSGSALAISGGGNVVYTRGTGDYYSSTKDLGVRNALAARFVGDDVAVLRRVGGQCVVERRGTDGALLDSADQADGACVGQALASAEGTLYLLDGEGLRRDGAWLAEVAGDELAVYGGVALVATAGADRISAFDATNGDLLWTRRVDGAVVDVAVGGDPLLAHVLWESDAGLSLGSWHAGDGELFDRLDHARAEPAGMAVVQATGQVLLLAGGNIQALSPLLEE